MEKSSTSFTTGFALRACLLLVGEPRADEADQDSWKLVHFIRRLPAITPDELEQMKEMNPRSPAELKEEEALERFLKGDDSQPPETEHKHH